VDNQENRLKAGMFADVKIHLDRQSEALVVPVEAVLDDKNRTIIFLKHDGAYVPRAVQTGMRDKGYIEILSGLEQGDEVVTRGNFQLKSKLYQETLNDGHVH
jgi:cobalt-zinc-cadmium efflux system membrane fusion protein